MGTEGNGAGSGQSLPFGPVCRGAIVMFAGTIDDDGHPLVDSQPNTDWQLCDGSNGTPDLRNSFIKSIGAGEQPGGSGGSATHTHSQHAAQSHSGAAVADHVFTQASDHPALSHSGAGVADHAAHTHGWGSIAVAFHAAWTHVTGGAHTHDSHGFNEPSDHAAWTHQTGGAHTHDNHTGTASKLGSSTGTPFTAPVTHASQGGHTHDQHAALSHTGASVTPTTHASQGGHTHDQHPELDHTVSGATDNPSAVLSHSVTQPDQHAAQSHSGGAVDAHQVTQPVQHAALSHAAASNEPVYYKLAFIQRL